jgi:hypothetical protein
LIQPVRLLTRSEEFLITLFKSLRIGLLSVTYGKNQS